VLWFFFGGFLKIEKGMIEAFWVSIIPFFWDGFASLIGFGYGVETHSMRLYFFFAIGFFLYWWVRHTPD